MPGHESRTALALGKFWGWDRWSLSSVSILPLVEIQMVKHTFTSHTGFSTSVLVTFGAR
jgi:hypothetical protein